MKHTACARVAANSNRSLVKEAAIESKKGGERGVTARSVRKVTAVRLSPHPLDHGMNTDFIQDTLAKFKG